MKIKSALVNELKSNEHVIQVLSIEQVTAELDFKNIDYTGWSKTLAGYVAPTQDVWLAKTLLREFGFQGKVLLKSHNNKLYVILKGYPGKRALLTGTRYLASNPQVVRMAVGPKGVMKTVKGGFVLTMVLSVGIEVVDYILSDNRALHNLLGTISGDIVKIGLAAILSAVTAAAVGGIVGVATTAAAPLIAAIAVGVLAGWALGKIDEKIGATAALINMYEKAGVNLNQVINDIKSIPNRVDREVYRWERYFINKAIRQMGY